ncbi:MAG: hypothetical protein WA777_18930 [Rhodanobacter sp.]
MTSTIDAPQPQPQATMAGRLHLRDQMIDYAGPSIGAIVAAWESHGPETLLAQADTAIYVVKRARKNSPHH